MDPVTSDYLLFTLEIWDFEGQEVRFSLSSQSLRGLELYFVFFATPCDILKIHKGHITIPSFLCLGTPGPCLGFIIILKMIMDAWWHVAYRILKSIDLSIFRSLKKTL